MILTKDRTSEFNSRQANKENALISVSLEKGKRRENEK
jgi:hypothetical protein